jgi:oligoendopeptidase F
MTDAAMLGALPEWDLSDLYAGRDDPALARDLAAAAADAAAFAGRFKGRIAGLDGAVLGAMLAEYEALEDRLGRIASFAGLLHAGDMSDPAVSRFYQTVNERLTAITAELLFVSLELNRLDDAALEAKLAAPALAHYRPWVEEQRLLRPHQLADDMEQLLHEKHVVGRAAWIRLFDETMAGLRFGVAGRRLTLEETLDLLSDRDEAARADAASALAAGFEAELRLFALITNTLAKDKAIEDRWRRMPSPAHARHLSNQVEPEVVEALRRSVREAYPRLSHRYYALKAKWLGKPKLEYWDRNAPLPAAEQRLIPWEEARELVLGAYGAFAPEMRRLGERFFDSPWIDAPARPGKAPGAFAHPTVPSAHPYLLLNYLGKPRDVMTLAHELGHGVHQVLAGPQGALLAGTPLTLAETASVFGEQLTFRALLDAERQPARKLALLAQKVEDMLNTVVRQIAFYEFELRVHAERAEGELAPERLGEIWMAVQSESLGPAIELKPDYATYWCYIPHFVHSPFYVYAYAFGDCLVNSLYAVYRNAAGGFQEKYFELLRAGGTRRHKALLAPFGLDAGDPAFWRQGLGVIAGFIDELEEL